MRTGRGHTTMTTLVMEVHPRFFKVLRMDSTRVHLMEGPRHFHDAFGMNVVLLSHTSLMRTVANM